MQKPCLPTSQANPRFDYPSINAPPSDQQIVGLSLIIDYVHDAQTVRRLFRQFLHVHVHRTLTFSECWLVAFAVHPDQLSAPELLEKLDTGLAAVIVG